MVTRSIDPSVFQTVPELRLIGGRDRNSGRLAFPPPMDADPVTLPSHGRLWSYTVQRIAPKAPPYRGAEPFAPFAIGYVELPGALIVESRLIGVAFEELRIGMPMQLTSLPLYSDAGGEVLMYAFRPEGSGHP